MQRITRPPDPLCTGRVTKYALSMESDLATRWCLHLAFRDAVTVTDLTHGGGGCWTDPSPPGIVLTTSNIDPSAGTDLHVDYRRTGLPERFSDVVVFDPPHTADNGKNGHFAARYGGTAKGNAALIEDVVAGAREAMRIARIGIIAKIIDASHGGELVSLSDAVRRALEPARVYFELVTVKAKALRDPKHKVQRVPDNNGAIYLAFRKDGHRHRDFDRLYARQQG